MGAKTLLRPELRDRLVESKWSVQFGHTGQIMRKSYERVITSKVYTSSSYLTCERERTRNFFVKLVKDVVGPLPLLLELPDP